MNDFQESTEIPAPIRPDTLSFGNPFAAPTINSFVREHIEKFVGEVETVVPTSFYQYEECGLSWVRPTTARPFHTFVACASMNPQTIFSICLPGFWDLEDKLQGHWPIHQVQRLAAQYPHQQTIGTLIPYHEPGFTFAENTEMNTLLLLPSAVFSRGFHHLAISPAEMIPVLTLIPIYEEEAKRIVKKGVESIFKKFDRAGVNDILNPGRENTCEKKGLMGMW